MIEFASGQITGRRAAQEDALDVLQLGAAAPVSAPAVNGSTPLGNGLVMVVADGMGGHVGGRVASTLSVKAFLDTVRTSSSAWAERLEAGLNAANDALRLETESHPDLSGMGSTLVGAVVSEAGLGWISIGDSALYLYRAGTLARLNEDHSFGAYLDQQARDGLMTTEAAAADRRRNHLFYALLGDHLDHYERFSGFRNLVEDDLVVVASDGLKTLPDEKLGELLAQFTMRPIDDVVAELLKAVETEDRERQDNVSIIVARISRPSFPSNNMHRDAPTADRNASHRPPAPPLSPLPPSPPSLPSSPGAVVRMSPRARRMRIIVVAAVALLVAGIVALGVVHFSR